MVWSTTAAARHGTAALAPAPLRPPPPRRFLLRVCPVRRALPRRAQEGVAHPPQAWPRAPRRLHQPLQPRIRVSAPSFLFISSPHFAETTSRLVCGARPLVGRIMSLAPVICNAVQP